MTTGLRRFLGPAPAVRAGERCELCGEPIPAEHGHVVGLENREIKCTCRGCTLLFTRRGAGKFRAVPDRYRHSPALAGAAPLWESAGIPVRMAFFFVNSALDTPVAFYPSPAGATESLLGLDAWTELIAANPELATLEPDVEAVLIMAAEGAYEGFLVPIDQCYQLVGLVRLHWRGFDGGTEAWEQIGAFFDGLRARSLPLNGAGDG